MPEPPFLLEKFTHIIENLLHVSKEGAEVVVMSWLVAVFIIALSLIGILTLRLVPKRLQNFLEFVVQLLLDFSSEIFNSQKKARFFLPLIGTLALFIFISNMMGLIPGLRAPTANWSTTIGLALVVFVSTHVFGIKEKGILKYLSEFIGPAWYLAIITIPINIIDHLARVLSLSLRLFANMMAKHCILTLLALTLIILSAKPILLLQTLGIPVMLLPIVMGLGVITCFIQAFIFTLLSLIYISEATSLEERH